MTSNAAKTVSIAAFHSKARGLFGKPSNWRFVCPNCSTSYSLQEMKDAGAPNPYAAAGQECIGRYRTDEQTDKARGCQYAAFGLIPLDELVPVKLQGGKVILSFPFDYNEVKNQ
jgi:hypothetical protein